MVVASSVGMSVRGGGASSKRNAAMDGGGGACPGDGGATITHKIFETNSSFHMK